MEWHYGISDTVYGPISDDQLLKLVREGIICPGTLVWTEYLIDWVPAEDVEGLFLAAGKLEPALTAVGTLSPWSEIPENVTAAPSLAPKTQPVPEHQAFARIWEKSAPARQKEPGSTLPSSDRRTERPVTRQRADISTSALAERQRASRAPSNQIATPTPTDATSPPSGSLPASRPTETDPSNQLPKLPAAPPSDFSPPSFPVTEKPPTDTLLPSPLSQSQPQVPVGPSSKLPNSAKLPTLNPYTQAPPGAGSESDTEAPTAPAPPTSGLATPPQPKFPTLNPYTQAPPGAGPESDTEAPIPAPPTSGLATPPQPKLPTLNPYTQVPPGAGPESDTEAPTTPAPPTSGLATPPQLELPTLNPFTKAPPTTGQSNGGDAHVESEAEVKVDSTAPAVNPFTQAPLPTTSEIEKAAAREKEAKLIARADAAAAAKKSSLPPKKTEHNPKPLADLPKRDSSGKSAFNPAPAPVATPAPSEKRVATGASDASLDREKTSPASATAESSKKWKRPEGSTPKRLGRLLPFLLKSTFLLGLSAGSAFGLHAYRAKLVAEIPVEPPPPPPVVVPETPPEQTLAHHLACLARTDFQNILFWDIEASRNQPGWVSSAPPIPLLKNLSTPVELPAWILQSAPESALIADFSTAAESSPDAAPLAPVTLLRVPEDVAVGLAIYFPKSDPELVSGFEMFRASSAVGDPSVAAIYLDDRTLAVAPEATLQALFHFEKAPKPDPAILGLAQSFKDAAPVVSASRQTVAKPETSSDGQLLPTTQLWEASLMSANEKGLTLELGTISIGGPPPPGSPPPTPMLHPDLLLDRVLLSREIEMISDARRQAKPNFPDSRIAFFPSALFLKQDTTPAPGTVPPQPYRYLPDFYRAVASHDLKKIRENPHFGDFRNGEMNPPLYWQDLDKPTFGLLVRDLDQIHSCSSELGNCHVLVSRFPLKIEDFGKTVDPLAGYTIKGLDLYPVQPQSTAESSYLCIVEERIAVIAPSAILERIIRQAGEPSPLQPYMEDLYPMAAEFEESLFLRVEGRTGDVRYHGVQALFFGENYSEDGYDSRRVIKCRSAKMAEEFSRLMRRRREDAAAEKIGTTVADLLSVGMNEGYLVIGAKVPDDLWETYSSYFKNVILPES